MVLFSLMIAVVSNSWRGWLDNLIVRRLPLMKGEFFRNRTLNQSNLNETDSLGFVHVQAGCQGGEHTFFHIIISSFSVLPFLRFLARRGR